MKSKEKSLTSLTTAAAEYDVLISNKEAKIADLTAEASVAKSEIEKLQKSLRDTATSSESSKANLKSAQQDNEKLVKNLSRVQQELDGLRKLMSAKQSEDAQRKEADKSREKELEKLRADLVASIEAEKRSRETSSQTIEELKSQIKDAQAFADQRKVHVDELETRLSDLQGKLEKQTDLLSATAKVVKGLEFDLAESRKRLIDRDREFDAVAKAKDGFERSLGLAQTKLSDQEDAILLLEREKVDWAGKLDSANREFKNQQNRLEAMETESRNMVAENKVLRQQADHAKVLSKMQEDEIVLLRSRENKTIVEHVHVLEKAKKVTDRELASTKMERDQLLSVMKSMEQQKTRLIGDIEDMARQNDILRADVRAAEKAQGSSPEDLQREKEARQQAEARAAQLEKLVPKSEQVTQLQERHDKDQASLKKLEKDLADALSKVKPQQQELIKLRAQGEKDQKEISTLRKQLATATEDALKTNGTPRTSSGHQAHPSIKALQELQLGNEQLSQSMVDELQKNKFSSRNPNSRATDENNPQPATFGTARTKMTTVSEDTSKLLAVQQTLERDIRQLRSELQTTQNLAKDAQKGRTEAEARVAATEKRLKDMSSMHDPALSSSAGFAARLNKEMEKERARYQQDLQEFERTVHQTRAKYQAELAQLTEDLGSQRDNMLRFKEANRLLKAKEEELRRELEDELHSSSGWKRERERLESRIVDLNTALEAASSKTDETQGQQVRHVAQMKDLRRKLDESET